jgi:hypothetical protein
MPTTGFTPEQQAIAELVAKQLVGEQRALRILPFWLDKYHPLILHHFFTSVAAKRATANDVRAFLDHFLLGCVVCECIRYYRFIRTDKKLIVFIVASQTLFSLVLSGWATR